MCSAVPDSTIGCYHRLPDAPCVNDERKFIIRTKEERICQVYHCLNYNDVLYLLIALPLDAFCHNLNIYSLSWWLYLSFSSSCDCHFDFDKKKNYNHQIGFPWISSRKITLFLDHQIRSHLLISRRKTWDHFDLIVTASLKQSPTYNYVSY